MSRRYFDSLRRPPQTPARAQNYSMNTGGGGATDLFSSPQPQQLMTFGQDVSPRYGDTSYSQSSFSSDYNSSYGSDGYLSTPVRPEENYSYESSSTYGRGMNVGMGYLAGMNVNGGYSRTTLASTPQLPSVDFCSQESYRPAFSPYGSVTQEHSFIGRGSSMFQTTYGRPLASSGYAVPFRDSRGTFPRTSRAGHLRGRKNFASSRGTTEARTRNTLFCELCKVSCVGQQAYDEHVKGQRHAKRETQAKAVNSPAEAKGTNRAVHHCKICNIYCTGAETLKAHQRGIKHQRAVKLQESMGKEQANGESVSAAPEVESVKTETEEPAKPGEEQMDVSVSAEVLSEKKEDQTLKSASPQPERGPEIVGEEYLTFIPASRNKAAQFRCRLCNCEFSDLQAKDTHLRGRRHRINFKKTVEGAKEDKSPSEETITERPLVSEADTPSSVPGDGQFDFGIEPSLANPLYELNEEIERYNDALFLRKLKDIEPLKEVTSAVSTISDFLVSHLANIKLPFVKEETTETSDNATENAKANAPNPKTPFVKILRVDGLAKGISVRGENRGDIVAVCNEMPTSDVFATVEQYLAGKVQAHLNKEEYSVSKVEEPMRAVMLRRTAEPVVEVYVHFAFAKKPLVNKETAEEKVEVQQAMETDCIEERQCGEALVAVRRTEWFERVRTHGIVTVLQMLYYLRNKEEPLLASLSDWTWQVLVANVSFGLNGYVGPSMLFTGLCEKISSGLLLPIIGIKVSDPCEYGKQVDLLDSLSHQHRLGLTMVFQKWLNLIALGLLDGVLKLDSKEAHPEKEPEDEFFDDNGEPKKLKIIADDSISGA
uniref:DZF domain-containing protein n=1 Tax=Trichuris muris TaxID=70415 RepID=A0A5S6QXQ9_TRIMR